MKKDAISQVLQLMEKHLGKSVFNDKAKFKAGISDTLGFLGISDSIKIRNLLIIAIVDMRAYARIQKAINDKEMFAINNLVTEMCLDYMIDKTAALMVIESIAELLEYDGQFAPSLHQVHIKKGKTIIFGKYNWLVLQSSNKRALIITEDIIERRAYYSKFGEVAWKNCSLRQYLNTVFYNTFSNEEQSRIYQVWNDDSLDNVFLLSIYEARSLFLNDNARIAAYSGVASWWWLRSYGDNGTLVAGVNFDGSVQIYGSYARSGDGGGVRPALWLSLDDNT